MKTKVNTKELKAALELHARVVNGKQNYMLAGVRLKASKGKLEIYSTDLEVNLKSVIGGEVEKNGEAVIPYKVLRDVVKLVDTDQVDIELVEDKCRVDVVKVNTMPLEEYPLFPELSDRTIGIKHFNFDSLMDPINKIKGFVSTDESRIMITGILFDTPNNCLVATDSYRLGKAKVYLGKDMGQFVVPVKLFDIVNKIKPKPKHIDLMVDGETKDLKDNEGNIIEKDKLIANICLVSAGNHTITTRILSGKYPDYIQIINYDTGVYPKVYRIEVKDMVKKLDKAIKFGKDFGNEMPLQLKFDTTQANLYIDIKELGILEDSIDIKTVKNEQTPDLEGNIDIAFNPSFLKEGILIFGNKVNLYFRDNLRPVLICNDSELQYALMPVRIS